METYFVVYDNGHVLQARSEKECKEHIAKYQEACMNDDNTSTAYVARITHVIKGKSMSWQTEVQVLVSLSEEE